MASVLVSGTPASATPLRSGVATIPLLATSVDVADTAITASSVVVCAGAGAPDATATLFSVNAQAGVGIRISCNVAPTIAKDVSWAVLRY